MPLGSTDSTSILEASRLRSHDHFIGINQCTSRSSGARWPKLTGSPVLDSLHPVIEHFATYAPTLRSCEVAQWMAYEELAMPDYQLPFGGKRQRLMT